MVVKNQVRSLTLMGLTISLFLILLGPAWATVALGVETISLGPNSSYDIGPDGIVIISGSNGMIVVEKYSIDRGEKASLTINVEVTGKILDVDQVGDTLYILEYTRLLGRDLLILYKYTESINTTSRLALDLTGEDILTANYIPDTGLIAVLTESELQLYNLTTDTIVSRIKLGDMQYFTIDEASSQIAIITIDTSGKSTLYTIYSNGNITEHRIDGAITDIDDATGLYYAVEKGNTSKIIDNNGTVVFTANGIITSIVVLNNTQLYYNLVTGNITALLIYNIMNGTHFLLANDIGVASDMQIYKDKLIILDIRKSIHVIDINNVKIIPITGEEPDNSTHIKSSNTTTQSTTIVNTISYSTVITILKISATILLTALILLIARIVTSRRK